MEELTQELFACFEREGIEYDASSLSKHHSQGIVSTVYTVSTSAGELIVHLSELTPSLKRLRVPDKLRPVSRLLRTIPGVPAAEILFVHELPKHFIVAQKKLPGISAGRVVLEKGEIQLLWDKPVEKYEHQIEDIVADIHAAPMRGFGPLVEDEAGLRGQYDTWEDFLRTEVAFWIDGMAQEDHERGITDSLTSDLHALLQCAILELPCVRASLISCDLTNPSNILVEGGRVTGIVDWEWAMIADAAWEFGNMNRYKLKDYFSKFPELSSPKAKKRFLLRTNNCQPFLWAMWAYSHVGRSNQGLYLGARDQIKKSLGRFL